MNILVLDQLHHLPFSSFSIPWQLFNHFDSDSTQIFIPVHTKTYLIDRNLISFNHFISNARLTSDNMKLIIQCSTLKKCFEVWNDPSHRRLKKKSKSLKIFFFFFTFILLERIWVSDVCSIWFGPHGRWIWFRCYEIAGISRRLMRFLCPISDIGAVCCFQSLCLEWNGRNRYRNEYRNGRRNSCRNGRRNGRRTGGRNRSGRL